MGALHKNCPKCGAHFENSRICNKCGADILIFTKTGEMSLAYYNKGLKMANLSNLTGAIQNLQTALAIDKKNIQARNLLGLCFFTIGCVGDALREWVISTNYETNSNIAQEYLDAFNADMKQLEKFSEGLCNYNDALQFLHQYNEDMAIIRLKRAIELVPNFVEALNLLTLVYLKSSDKMRAGSLVERVLAIDNANPTARRYYREVFRKKAPSARKTEADNTREGTQRQPNRTPQKTQPERAERTGLLGVQNQKVFNKRSPIPGIISFVAGLGAMFLFMYVLVLPSFLEGSLSDNAALVLRLETLEEEHLTQIQELEEEMAEISSNLSQSQTWANILQNQNADIQNENWVNTGHTLLSDNMFTEALAAVQDVDVDRLSEESFAVYNQILSTAKPVIERQYFEQGQGLYNGGNNAEARAALEWAAIHITEGSNIADYIFYLLGRIAEDDGDFDLAREYYETIINHHPGTPRTAWANTRLNMISQR